MFYVEPAVLLRVESLIFNFPPLAGGGVCKILRSFPGRVEVCGPEEISGTALPMPVYFCILALEGMIEMSGMPEIFHISQFLLQHRPQ